MLLTAGGGNSLCSSNCSVLLPAEALMSTCTAPNFGSTAGRNAMNPFASLVSDTSKDCSATLGGCGGINCPVEEGSACQRKVTLRKLTCAPRTAFPGDDESVARSSTLLKL